MRVTREAPQTRHQPAPGIPWRLCTATTLPGAVPRQMGELPPDPPAPQPSPGEGSTQQVTCKGTKPRLPQPLQKAH